MCSPLFGQNKGFRDEGSFALQVISTTMFETTGQIRFEHRVCIALFWVRTQVGDEEKVSPFLLAADLADVDMHGTRLTLRRTEKAVVGRAEP